MKGINNDMVDIKFNYYGANIKETIPLGMVSLGQMVQAIQQPNESMKTILQNIAHFSSTGDMDTKAYWKKQLYFFTPAIVCTRRRYEDIISFTGLMPVDFDKLEDRQYAIDFKQYLFDEYDCVIASWLSSSHLGVRALLKIPICTSTDEYKEYFEGFQQIAYKYNGFDQAPKNAVLPLFYSHDPNIVYRSDATTWTNKGSLPKDMPKVEKIVLYQDDKERHVANIIKKKIDAIHDYGHPPLRAIAYALGGYVGSGYISSDDAIRIIENEIRSNGYLGLRHKVNGYIRTAKDMISKGQLSPLSL